MILGFNTRISLFQFHSKSKKHAQLFVAYFKKNEVLNIDGPYDNEHIRLTWLKLRDGIYKKEIALSTMKPEWLRVLKEGSHIHLMGISGTAMASLAGLLQQKGYRVTGSDQNIYPPMSLQLQKLGIPFLKSLEQLHPSPDLVVVGNVMTRKHKEVQFLLASQIPYTSFPEIMGNLLIADKNSIVPCGTHGKTTCTALLSWVLTACGQNPGFLIGGVPKNFDFSFSSHFSQTKTPLNALQKLFFIIEGDEYDSAFFAKHPKFIHYKPKYVILTSIEMDHIDIYPNFKAVQLAFQQLLKIIPPKGVLIANGQDATVCQMLSQTACQNIKIYALSPESSHLQPDYWAENIQKTKEGTSFEVHSFQGFQEAIELSLFGHYNVANALAVYALISQLPITISRKKQVSAFKSFLGVKRRQEIIGKSNGILVIDDFAHHPTSVQQTIQSVQDHFEKAHVISVFEPRSATSRRKLFQQDYVEAFLQAKCVILSEVYQKEKLLPSERLCVKKLVQTLQERKQDFSGKVFLAKTRDEVIDLIQANLQKEVENVVLIMSNGGFDGLQAKLLSTLKTTF